MNESTELNNKNKKNNEPNILPRMLGSFILKYTKLLDCCNKGNRDLLGYNLTNFARW